MSLEKERHDATHDGTRFKAHRLLYHSTPGLRVIKKKKKHTRGLVGACRSFRLWFLPTKPDTTDQRGSWYYPPPGLVTLRILVNLVIYDSG